MSEVAPSTPEAAPETNTSLLAQEVFGSNYHGEVRPDPEPVESQEATSIEEVAEPVEEAPEPVEVSGEESQPEAQESEEGETLSSLSDLIEAEGYNQEEFMSLEVEQKIDGETRRVKLSDVLATNQTLEAAEHRLSEVKEKAKSQNKALADKEQELDSAFQVAAAVLHKQKAGFEAREKALNSSNERKQDPAEWNAKKTELADQRKAFELELQQFYGAYQQHKQKAETETEQQQAARLQKEHENLLEQLPEWGDEKVREKEQEELSKYLASQDLTPESFKTISYDHKLLLMARKAAKYDEVQAKAEPAKKKLAKVPKTLKPGSKPAPVNPNQQKISELQGLIASDPNSGKAIKWATELRRLRRGN